MSKKEYSDCSSGDETLSGESHLESGRGAELSEESYFVGPGHDDLSRESITGQLTDRILSGESRNKTTG